MELNRDRTCVARPAASPAPVVQPGRPHPHSRRYTRTGDRGAPLRRHPRPPTRRPSGVGVENVIRCAINDLEIRTTRRQVSTGDGYPEFPLAAWWIPRLTPGKTKG